MYIWQIDPVGLTPYYDINVAEALADAGHKVRFITSPYLYDPTIQYPDSISVDLIYFKLLTQPILLKLPIIRKSLRGILYPWGHWQVLQKMKRRRPDVVHIQWSRFPKIDRWFVASIKRLGIPIVHTIHDVEPLFTHGIFAGHLRDVYQPYVDAFIVHTEENRRRFLEHYPSIDPSKIRVIPHIAVRVGGNAKMPLINRETARTILSINSSTFIVMFFGLIKPYKGLDVLAKAIPLVLEQHPHTQIWIVGKPDSEADRRMLDEIQTSWKQVHIVAQYIPAADVPLYHQAADLMIFPYHQISQSGALITAMSFGCAVIVTDVGGLPDLVRGNGWIIPPNNPTALADRIITAINAPETLSIMRDRSLQLIDNELSPRVIAHQHIDLYQSLIEHLN